MKLLTEPYLEQIQRWPPAGQHILAQYDEDTIVVYQAFCPSIAYSCFAVEHGYLGGPDFSLKRMSWIKPNFLWMMHRSGWATKPGQDHVLAIRLQRVGFEQMLAQAVSSSYQPDDGQYPSQAAWQQAVAESEVRLQWDPDHDPTGQKVSRRAIQLGLRGQMLLKYVQEWTVDIEDITEFVRANGHNPPIRNVC
jgi:Domain of unknown function (DUF4291)